MGTLRLQRGITLVEMVVAVGLLSCMLLASLHVMNARAGAAPLRDAAQSFGDGLRGAQRAAIERNGPVTFWMVSGMEQDETRACVLSAEGPHWVVSGGRTPEPCASERLQESARRDAAEGKAPRVSASTAAGEPAVRVTFDGFGRVAGGAGQLSAIDIRAAGASAEALRITVSRGGEIRVCDPAAPARDVRACRAGPSA